ncbi:hypothetical protein [Prevotella sp. P2-180]|uniref:hypothetical protein n=1 Tax=Prevotella sp. P2-180 TaxID=2024224 RepID=UPI000B9780C4|nr:hypothetical protein [Prevotella sp. P2-180]OYP60925.1 hypothetical protein CIK98_15535 [Prevotella sp. P2-180]
MNNNEIQRLIDRYLNGVTTPEEEQQLARALLGGNIPDEWKVVRIMLGELAMGEAEYDADMAKKASRKKSFVLPVPVRWLIAASVALLIGFVCFNSIESNEDNVVAEMKTDKPQEHRMVSNNAVSNESPTKEQTDGTNTGLTIHNSNVNNIIAKVTDENLHYASNVINDTVDNYQSPSRMEEFIVKIANYHHIKCDSLSCAIGKDDSDVVSTAYVFPDTEELDLFRRLLQAACWYDDKMPGYLLNYSHQQFFFCLKDMRKGLKYLWIAERVRNKILLYSTHSPLDTEVSSDGFREYRDKLSNTSINQKSKKI